MTSPQGIASTINKPLDAEMIAGFAIGGTTGIWSTGSLVGIATGRVIAGRPVHTPATSTKPTAAAPAATRTAPVRPDEFHNPRTRAAFEDEGTPDGADSPPQGS